MLTSPVTFEPCGIGREVVKLGDVQIGFVVERETKRGVRAYWMMSLPDDRHCPVPAPSFEAARRQVDEMVWEWLARAGLCLVRSEGGQSGARS